jgi:hypothetical protein
MFILEIPSRRAYLRGQAHEWAAMNKYIWINGFFTIIFSVGCSGDFGSPPKQIISVHQKDNEMFFTKKYNVKLSESGQDWLKRHPDKVKIDKQPAGLDFYLMNWGRPRGVVKIEHGKYSFEIVDALSVMGTYNVDYPNEGISSIDISAGMSVPSPSLISHDEARIKMYALLKKIQKTGWKIHAGRGDPRIKGKDRLEYVLNDDKYIGLDLEYIPNFNEWMKIDDRTPWIFYADHQYLTISFQREPTLKDPLKPGSYLLDFELETETNYYKSQVDSRERKRYKELLPNELAGLAKVRREEEAKLKQKGIPIDESYEDSPLPPGVQALPPEQYVPDPNFGKPSPAEQRAINAEKQSKIDNPNPLDESSYIEGSAVWQPASPPSSTRTISPEELTRFRDEVQAQMKSSQSLPEGYKTAAQLLAQNKSLKP